MNELIDILNSGNKEELKAFLNLYSKPIYERALALRGDKEEGRACAKRTMAQVVRLAKQHALSYDIDAQLMRLTDICCNDEAYERMLLGDIVEEVMAETDEEYAPISVQSVSAEAPLAHRAEATTPVKPETPNASAVVAPPMPVAAPSAEAEPSILPFKKRESVKSASSADADISEAVSETADELSYFKHSPAMESEVEPPRAERAAQATEPDVSDVLDGDDDFDDDMFSPAAQRRAKREAKKRERLEKRSAAKSKKQQNDFFDADAEDEEDELLLFSDEEKPKQRVKKTAPVRAAIDADDDELLDDDEETGVSPGMVVLIFVLAVIVVLFVWILLVKLSTMGVISMADFGFAEWFNQNIFKLY